VRALTADSGSEARHELPAFDFLREQRLRLQHEAEAVRRGDFQRLPVVRAKSAGLERAAPEIERMM
jgi:hypothetical protein